MIRVEDERSSIRIPNQARVRGSGGRIKSPMVLNNGQRHQIIDHDDEVKDDGFRKFRSNDSQQRHMFSRDSINIMEDSSSLHIEEKTRDIKTTPLPNLVKSNLSKLNLEIPERNSKPGSNKISDDKSEIKERHQKNSLTTSNLGDILMRSLEKDENEEMIGQRLVNYKGMGSMTTGFEAQGIK